MQKLSVAFHTLGCKVNTYETEAIKEQFEQAGFTVKDFEDTCDVYVINTCSVTNIADRKSRQMLHKAKKNNPNGIVVATGCYVQAAKELLLNDEAVDIVVGNNKKSKIVEIVESYMKNGANNKEIIDLMHGNEYEELKISSESERTRACVKVQDGCNQFCSYCIIPYTRGRVRSRKLSDCISEIEKLCDNGYQEIVLTGIHLSSYGVDFEEKIGLIDLIEAVAKIDGVKRIRLGSLEPRIVTVEFIERMNKTGKVCPHFHLSLQSGSDTVLKRMNRRYDTKEYKEKCDLLRQYVKDVMLTTDVIVGFPGETEEEFCETYEYLKDIKFYETHIFKYSRRQGTVADKLPNQVDEAVKTKRSDILLELDRCNQAMYNTQNIGNIVDVLVEEKTKLYDTEYYIGHTMNYIKVAFLSDEDLGNKIVSVKLTEIYKDRIVKGEIIENS